MKSLIDRELENEMPEDDLNKLDAVKDSASKNPLVNIVYIALIPRLVYSALLNHCTKKLNSV